MENRSFEGQLVSPMTRILLLGLLATSGLACASASPVTTKRLSSVDHPIFRDVAISGLVYRDERIAGRTQSTGVMVGAATGSRYSALSTASATGQSVAFESFDNDSLQAAFKRMLEDSRIARRVVQVNTVRIEGLIKRTDPSTGALRIIWNVFNAVSLLGLFASPYLGTYDAEIQLRVYDNEEMIGTYDGFGRAKWWSNANPFAPYIAGRRVAFPVATESALDDALAKLVAKPPRGNASSGIEEK